MSVGEDVGADHDLLASRALDREPPGVDFRMHALDDDAPLQRRVETGVCFTAAGATRPCPRRRRPRSFFAVFFRSLGVFAISIRFAATSDVRRCYVLRAWCSVQSHAAGRRQ